MSYRLHQKSRYDLRKAIRDSKSFKKTTIIPVPKKNHAACLNDYSLTSIIMKRCERLVMAHINSSFPNCLRPLQFASTEGTTSLALHYFLEHLDHKDTYIRLLLIDYIPTFNTIFPDKSVSKLL
eukprot:g37002.t1